MYDLNEPVFPDVCEYAGVTLSRYVLEMASANPDKPELVELVSVMMAVERACKTISNLVRRAPMSGLTGLEDGGGSINIQGEEQKKVCCRACRPCHLRRARWPTRTAERRDEHPARSWT